MRILSISLGRRGGFPLYGLEMTRALARRASVSALVSSGADNIAAWRESGFDMMEVHTYGGALTGVLSFFNFPKFLRLKKFMASRCPDVIYYPGGHYWKPVLDLIAPRRVPIVMTVHDPVVHPGERTLVQRAMSAIDVRRPDACVLLNESQRAGFMKSSGLPDGRVAVIPLGVFSSYVKFASRLGDFPSFSSLAPLEGKYFLFLGRIAKYQGIETLLSAWRDVAGQTGRALVIAGGGDFSPSERALIANFPPDKLKVLNRWLSDAEMATLTKHAYMTVLPYEGASQSGVIAASAAFGVPSVASDSGGLPDQIADGETGLLFPAGDRAALGRALTRASGMSPDDYGAMREKSRKRAYDEWDWNALAGKLIGFLENILSETKPKMVKN
jgi:glycosyltransferase involved in cell wall biosynthesis